MIRTLIIEDEMPAALRLEKMLFDVEPSVEIVGKPDSVSAALKWFGENPPPDLLILDIQLGDGLSFDIFRKVQIDGFVIFTTAFDEYAIRAFELNSIDYLLKPIDKKKLARSIQKFKELQKKNIQFDIQQLLQAMESRRSAYKQRFAISIGTKITSVETGNIAYFYSLGKNTFLCTFDKHEYPLEFSLDRVEEMVSPDEFFHISRQYIVNFKAIEKINILSKSQLELTVKGCTEKLPVSRARTHDFRGWIDK
jgi:DNA-binding LytR/AlgR family response regulator